jgi:hypothetical protein
VFVENQPTDAKTHETALRIAQGCLWIIRCLLREEEWGDAQTEFYRVARRELETAKGSLSRDGA